jgi:glycosyltransferase involved in cell wall biosynthesis
VKILWLTWKDYTHPQAGGAEIVLRELSKRLVAEGHAVTLLTVRHPGSKAREILDGIEIIRVGTNRYIHPFQALAHYLRHLRNRYDAVIEIVNTAPYFGALFKGKAKGFVFCHQLAREIWHHELKKPFSNVGYYLLEPIALRVLSWGKTPVITISESTRKDLERFGFKKDLAHIISEGIEIEPVPDLDRIRKFPQPTMISLGAMRAMKRTLDQIRAYEIAKKELPQLKLIVAGATEGEYARQVLEHIAASPYKKDIAVEGKVSFERKVELMQKSHIIAVTSVKEGWGLVVTEAASQGTPAVVYDVDGLRDSVHSGETGIVTDCTPAALAQGMLTVFRDKKIYDAMRQAAWQWSRDITFNRSYKDFKQVLELA